MDVYDGIDVVECCIASAIAQALSADSEGGECGVELTPVVVDCDLGEDPCCNRVTVTSELVESRGSDGNAKLFDLLVDVRVTRSKLDCPPPSAVCDPETGGCVTVGSDVKAERARLTADIASILKGCVASCCEMIVVEGRASKICGGPCSGSRIRVRLKGFTGRG